MCKVLTVYILDMYDVLLKMLKYNFGLLADNCFIPVKCCLLTCNCFIRVLLVDLHLFICDKILLVNPLFFHPGEVLLIDS